MASDVERRRRERRLREEMEREGYDALLLIGRDGMWSRGYIRYLTDFHLWGGTAYLVFPLHAEPILLLGSNSMAHWARKAGWVQDVRVATSGLVEAVARSVRERKVDGRLGVCGLHRLMSYGDAQALAAELPGVILTDATEVIERVRVIKSDEEIAGLAETCRIAAEAMGRFRDVLAPGRTEREVVAEAWKVLRERGVVDGIAHITTEDPPFIRPPSDRRLEREDVVKFSMEVTGPSGYCEELAAVFSFQEPPEEQRRMFDTTVKAVRLARTMLRPGVRAAEVVAAVEAAFRQDGWDPLHRVIWDAHGIGLDVIEPPLLTGDSQATLQAGMAISLHPGLTYGARRLGFYLQDNHIVSEGGAVPMAGWPDVWTVVG
ncbi:MAG: M24 family metallopeptidase [Armatimonadota bacterium]|nr:M24 family metallopeptidase [Armatimonadota bacterium]MDR7488520.1 M24 family metallopeptidase [Armatimonadota bacterium]MDR7573789.1 M24 family metallopeptidase [Armatimonadota bacterium]MDR7586536.1 M24 family metallopeptidase [Armatimonadota bacterium]